LYKKATDYIAGWIAETATSIGFEVKTKEQKQAKSKSKGKKGAGKKGNRKADAGTIYQLRVSAFVPMAEAIAKAGEVAEAEIMVPVALCKHFSRAIQTRRKVSQWYKAKLNAIRTASCDTNTSSRFSRTPLHLSSHSLGRAARVLHETTLLLPMFRTYLHALASRF
jgi:hypothetical protein